VNDALKKDKRKYTRVKRKKTSRLPRWRFRCLPAPARFSTVIVLSSEARALEELLIVYVSLVITGIVSYLVLRLGERVLIRLGRTGIRVLTRIMGLILAAVAVQFVISGIKEAFSL
jgi:multiple antibiotic resistance protein